MVDFLLSPTGALAIALLSTFIAWAESSKLPWSPFLILYAITLPLPALFLETSRFGIIGEAFTSHAGILLGLSILMLTWEIGLMGFAYEKFFLVQLGKHGNPIWSPVAALESLLAATARVGKLTLKLVKSWYGFYFLIWAPLAEELFFWGYLYPIFRQGNGPVTTSLLVAFFFGIRHGLHFTFLRGPFPWPAAAAIMLSAAGAGFLNGLLFEATQSLWPLIILHVLANLLSLTISPGSRDRSSVGFSTKFN